MYINENDLTTDLRPPSAKTVRKLEKILSDHSKRVADEKDDLQLIDQSGNVAGSVKLGSLSKVFLRISVALSDALREVLRNDPDTEAVDAMAYSFGRSMYEQLERTWGEEDILGEIIQSVLPEITGGNQKIGMLISSAVISDWREIDALIAGERDEDIRAREQEEED